MKVKTSVTLSEDVLRQMDERIGRGGSRSRFIEEALQQRLRELRRNEREARDRVILARMAADSEVQKEVLENLDFAVPWSELGDEVEVSDEVLARWAREDAARETR